MFSKQMCIQMNTQESLFVMFNTFNLQTRFMEERVQ